MIKKYIKVESSLHIWSNFGNSDVLQHNSFWLVRCPSTHPVSSPLIFLQVGHFSNQDHISSLTFCAELPSAEWLDQLELVLSLDSNKTAASSGRRWPMPWIGMVCRCQFKESSILPLYSTIAGPEVLSFDDSDHFEEDSLCSWMSEPESLCRNWRGWQTQLPGCTNVSELRFSKCSKSNTKAGKL